MAVEFIDLEPRDPRIPTDVLPVLRELRPHLTAESLAAVYQHGHPQGLRFTAAYDTTTGTTIDTTTHGRTRCVGVAGWRIVDTTAVIRKLYVDDLVTTHDQRSQGVGQALLAELTERARAAGCHVIDLDSGVQRTGAHRFYMREGFAIASFHFAREIATRGG
jgi:GNAT superfamily N-acetyltransferase